MIKVDFSLFPPPVVTPAVVAESGQFIMKLAENEDEVQKALRLRYEVFTLEQGKGLESSRDHGIDVDEFDEYCLQLILVEKSTARVIGTYRVHLGCVASKSMGFYSATEFHLDGLDAIAHLSMEVGRSCVAPDYRTGAGVALLWGGIGELMKRAKLRYLFGCVSLETTDPAGAWAVHEHLKQQGKISDILRATPKPGFEVPRPPDERVQAILSSSPGVKSLIPPLLKGYVRLGARICGEPAHDKAFGTMDFFILLDTAKASTRYTSHYNYQCEAT